jgi:hypothetical protein
MMKLLFLAKHLHSSLSAWHNGIHTPATITAAALLHLTTLPLINSSITAAINTAEG